MNGQRRQLQTSAWHRAVWKGTLADDGFHWVGDVAPGTADVATFDATSVKDATISVAGINIVSTYTGTITRRLGDHWKWSGGFLHRLEVFELYLRSPMLHQIPTGIQDFNPDDRTIGSVIHGDIFGQPLSRHLVSPCLETNIRGINLGIVSDFHGASLLDFFIGSAPFPHLLPGMAGEHDPFHTWSLA